MTKLAVLALTAALLPAQTEAQRPDSLARIEGVVRNSLTNEPLGKVSVVLMMNMTGEKSFAAISDAEGKFVLPGVEPGQYRLSAQRNGFSRYEYGASSTLGTGSLLTLRKAERINDLVVKLIPQAVVTGRVTDADGEPMANVNVLLMRRGYQQGKRVYIRSSGAQTNDLGEYRIYGVPPGRYILLAEYRDYVLPPNAVLAGGSGETFASTYYPAALEPDLASPIVIAAGARQQGMDIRLTRQRGYRVSGRVTGGTATNGMAMLLPKNAGPFVGMERPAQVKADGKLEFFPVRPGTYWLHVELMSSDPRLSGRTEVTVGSGDVDGVTVAVSPGFDLAGRISLDEGGTAKFQEIRVQMEPAGGNAGPYGPGFSSVIPKEDGSFTLQRLRAGPARLSLYRLPEGFYVKSARLGEADALAPDFEFTGPGLLEIRISSGAGRIDGTVRNAKGDPAPGAYIAVIPASNRNPGSRLTGTVADQQASYSVKGLPPGEYTLYAIEGYEPGMEQDPEFAAEFQSVAEKVVVKERSTETKALRSAKVAAGEN